MDDPAEIAAMASEYISSIDNLSQEVQHIFKEIEHKDVKVQDLLPKIAAREAQLRDLLSKSGGGSGPVNPGLILSEADRIKAEKLADRIRADYARADELSSQKETLSKLVWRNTWKHLRRLQEELGKVSPALMESVAASTPGLVQPQLPPVSALPAVLANIPLPSKSTESEQIAGQKRKLPGSSAGTSSQKALPASMAGRGPRPSSADRASSSPGPGSMAGASGSAARGLAGTPGAPRKTGGVGTPRGGAGGSVLGRKSLGPSSGAAGAAELVAGEEEEGDEGDGAEGDTTLYCFCQRVSFGEMIACDSESCPYEWFHLPCVGVKPPLPNEWYCQSCKDRMEKEKEARGSDVKEQKKKRKKV